MITYVVTEIEHLSECAPEYRVVGVFSTKELAQAAMVKAIRVLQGDPLAEPWSQQVTDQGLGLVDSLGNSYTYNIILRTLDET